ncbi:hypothetical protein MJN54_31705, partial [Salmonella enterica subsp. enterica serovar Kentucky]|nr:hypothetical protein [Salmonella enterica subsp. enterica serovar Kentucky]
MHPGPSSATGPTVPPPAAESGANASDVVVDTPEPYERILCQKILMGISTIDIIR